MAPVRIVSLLLACFLAFISYKAQDPTFLLGSLFFFVMALLSIRNAGAVESPYVFLAISAASLFYSFTGLSSGQYTWHRHTITLQQDPQLFWAAFLGAFLLGIGVLAYVYAKNNKCRRNG